MTFKLKRWGYKCDQHVHKISDSPIWLIIKISGVLIKINISLFMRGSLSSSLFGVEIPIKKKKKRN